MLINRNTKIIGKKVVLVPYKEDHVPKYHEWMQSVELQELTASEPLSLEEEYNMQKSCMCDNNKLTFIVLDKVKYEETNNEIASMIGDTNLFLISNGDEIMTLVAEAEIMIAEHWARGQGRGMEAMMIMLNYGIDKLNIQNYIVKISENNEVSLQMFQKLGFAEISRSSAFKEVTLELAVDDKFRQFLGQQLCGIEEIDYS